MKNNCKCVTAAARYRCRNWDGMTCELEPKNNNGSGKSELQSLFDQLSDQEAAISNTYGKIKLLLRNSPLHVTDHAIVRYLERIQAFNIEEIKSKILTNQLLNLYSKLGDGEFPTGEDNIRAIIRKGSVVTILK